MNGKRKYFVVGDVAGEYDALMRLIRKHVNDHQIILLGDLVDRGPRSADVVSWAMRDPRVICLKGNHEDMMVNHFRKTKKYSPGLWEHNGGHTTIESYMMNYGDDRPPKTHIEWMENLPVFFETKEFIATHAPIFGDVPTERLEKISARDGWEMEFTPLWNRFEPQPRDRLQIFGHNSHWGIRKFETDGNLWAICLDQSRRRVLTGYDVATAQIFVEPYDTDE